MMNEKIADFSSTASENGVRKFHRFEKNSIHYTKKKE